MPARKSTAPPEPVTSEVTGPDAAREAAPDPVAGRPARDPAEIGRFIERFAGILYESGVPRMPARVFTALLAADAGQLTAAEIGEVLGVSPAAVSGAVRYLIQVGLVTSAGEPGSRRLSYSVPANVWQQLLTARNGVMSLWGETMREGVALLGADTPAGQRLTRSARFFDFVTAELPGVLARWAQYAGEAEASTAGEPGAHGIPPWSRPGSEAGAHGVPPAGPAS